MIGLIQGQVYSSSLGKLIILAGGVGYEVSLTDSSISRCKQGSEVTLFIKEQIKEDSFELFGFLNLEDKQLFDKLLSVKNVGPKVALAVLNLDSSDNIRHIIANGDTKTLQTAKGVGRRAAEQIVVELRDKLDLTPSQTAEDVVGRSSEQFIDEAVSALMSLGYSVSDAKIALMKVDSNLSVEERIKQALKG